MKDEAIDSVENGAMGERKQMAGVEHAVSKTAISDQNCAEQEKPEEPSYEDD